MAISPKPTSGPDQLPECSSPTCAQLHDREVVYSENGAFATTSAKLGDVYPSTYRTPKSRTMLSKVDSGFRRMMMQRQSLNRFFSAAVEIRPGSRLVCPAEFDQGLPPE